MDYRVVITGFKTAEAAEEFYQWYNGQGEQDIQIWWECRQSEDEPVGEAPYCDSKSEVIRTDNTIQFKIEN
jgi:hypothetical protein